MLKGVDISAIQGRVDFQNVAAAGVSFVIAKAAEGNRPSADPLYTWNVGHAKAAGLLVGPYCFAYPLPNNGDPTRTPDAQAQHHFQLSEGVGSNDGELPPFLDFEWPPPQDWAHWGCDARQIGKWCEDYLAAADAYWGCPMGLYSYPDFWAHLLDGGWDPTPIMGRPLWAASYPNPHRWPVDGENPAGPRGWQNKWSFWQINGGEMKMPGGGPPTDCDVFKGDLAALKSLCGIDPHQDGADPAIHP